LAAIVSDQKKFSEYGLSKLKQVPIIYFQTKPSLLERGENDSDALNILATAFGVTPENPIRILPIFQLEITININLLSHIVEKRDNGRERFALFAQQTLMQPYEVWRSLYDDNSYRYIYIGLFSDSRYHIAVIINIMADGNILWNYMNGELRSIEKLRVGELLHCENKE
jgi:hypothetical protein